ncbi:hypothetical protein [Brachybacterium nesterenkovii]|uniref:Uncharacterized protein n=1 Tax=Brachybacterium nesterenkovii TaxID=47847 RepID=A0A1X6X0Y7_9MICO|nr:hypothetical protein [Brachybacterium nesterenkovii]SLM91947.1 hypothetical protein FM110_07270 [Brachybacterium nesterenkovii]
MSHTPEGAHRAAKPVEAAETTSEGASLGLSIVLFLVLFLAFIGGLYVMSLMTPVLFLVGLGIVLLSLCGAFTLVPRFLT